jgi:hypothetical protein
VIRVYARCIITLVAMFLQSQHFATAEEPVIVLVPPFNGQQFGANVGTVIFLNVFRTTSWAPRDAWILWSKDPLPDTTYKAAEERAVASHATLILWGSVVKFGNDFLAQPLLVINQVSKSSSDDPINWKVGLDSTISVSVGIPASRYDLPPLVLTPEFLELYNTTSSIRIYERQANGALGSPKGEIGRTFKVLVNDGNVFKVQAENGQEGWVAVPQLDSNADLAFDFVGGLISLFRRDYPRAIKMLRDVSTSSESTIIRIDSLLLQALANVRMGEDPSGLINSALELNPYLQVSIKFKIVNLIAQMLSASGEAREAKALELLKRISESSYLFPAEDDWLDTSKKIALLGKSR